MQMTNLMVNEYKMKCILCFYKIKIIFKKFYFSGGKKEAVQSDPEHHSF